MFLYLCTMIASMTGFGKAESNFEDKKINVEIRSLNSKGLDLNLRCPSEYREKEIDIRKLVGSKLIRGKVDINIYVESASDLPATEINADLVSSYYQSIRAIEDRLDISSSDYTSLLLKMPEVFKPVKQQLTDSEWAFLSEKLEEALINLQSFRAKEGKALEEDFINRNNELQSLLLKIEEYEGERIETIKQRILKNLMELKASESYDSNRFEQEMIYYLEKLDITEEKVRLKNHCSYFEEVVDGKQAQGKKLGFICQEMGREINTIGSKANHAEIQKIVILMKDELEKIKEQISNVL